MLNNRLLLGLVSFGMSFGISLVTQRDLGKAALTGATTVPAAYVAAAIVNRRYYHQAENRLAVLTSHIAALQQRRMEAYQEFSGLLAEKDRVALALNSMQLQLSQMQFAEVPIAAAGAALSWNLGQPALPASPASGVSPTEIQTPNPELQQVLAEATTTKRKIEASLQSLQGELSILKSQAIEHRQTRDRLRQELATLIEQKQGLETETKTLRQEVQDLTFCRQELERFIDYAESKKQELDAGTHPLQLAMQQLQTEINSLHEELRSLETQVNDRQQQKAELDQQLADLTSQSPPVQTTPKKSDRTRTPAGNGHQATARPLVKSPDGEPRSPAQPSLVQASTITLPPLPKPGSASSTVPVPELPPEWTELMLHLAEHEILVLKAIVEQANPAPTIKRLAEENLTMPELLIDSINEQALDRVGDLIVDAVAAAFAIAPDHLPRVKALIAAYDATF